MADVRVQKLIVLIKTNKPITFMFGLSVFGLFLILGFMINEFISLAILSSIPWCDIEKSMCGGQGYHIGCQTEQFPLNKECQNIKLVDMDKQLKRVILNKHNEIRNVTASGFYDYNLINRTHQLNFPKASRMREIVWDDQLEEVAKFHALKCTFEHDQCRSTGDYAYVGQNIANKRLLRKNDDALNVMTNFIAEWYNERFTTNKKIFQNFLDKLNNNNGHYLLMVNEHVEKIGCAYIKFEFGKNKKRKLKMYGHQLTCNYSYSNMHSKAIFTSGEPKSDCKSLNSHGESIYKYLCGPMAEK